MITAAQARIMKSDGTYEVDPLDNLVEAQVRQAKRLNERHANLAVPSADAFRILDRLESHGFSAEMSHNGPQDGLMFIHFSW